MIPNVLKLVKERINQADAELLKWPFQNSSLNPFENFWTMFNSQVKRPETNQYK